MSRPLRAALALALAALMVVTASPVAAAPAPAVRANCAGQYQPVSQPLTDLGTGRYVRMDGTETGFTGGLYPEGRNVPPAPHAAGGLAQAAQVVPLNAQGQPDPAGGRIVLLSIGMSNTALEFREFRNRVRAATDVNPRLVVVSGAAAGQVAEHWLDPNGQNWQHIAARLRRENTTPAQVQVAWVKLTRTGGGDFPAKAEQLQADLHTIVRNLYQIYPNLKIVYLSSRTRAYQYWQGLSPEPAAFETGFAVKWLIEQQIEGDPALNYEAARGTVAAPWLAWGPYLWINGTTPRADGQVWPPTYLEPDCVHPADPGIGVVADLLLAFFRTDPTAQPWFLADPPTPVVVQPTPAPTPAAPDEAGGEGRVYCYRAGWLCVR